MIRFVCGNPGAGKGLYFMRLIVDELVNTQRLIVTNFALNIGELNSYLQRQHPDRVFDVVSRICFLTDEEVPSFYLRRFGRGDVETVMDEKGKPDRLKYSGNIAGVVYFLDEVQNFFNARKWAETGSRVLFYLSQHRKLGDDVWLATQHPKNVDTQFRSLAQDYIYLRNLSNERRGMFRLPNLFLWSQYLEPKTGAVGQMATASGSFRLDVEGLAACYQTAAGVGVPGTGDADKGKRKTGLHWAWIVGGAIAGLGGLVWFSSGGMDFLAKKIFGQVPKKVGLAATNRPVELKPQFRTPPEPAAVPPSVPPSQSLPDRRETKAKPVVRSSEPIVDVNGEAVWLTGYMAKGAVYVVYTSDGIRREVAKDSAAVVPFGLLVYLGPVPTLFPWPVPNGQGQRGLAGSLPPD